MLIPQEMIIPAQDSSDENIHMGVGDAGIYPRHRIVVAETPFAGSVAEKVGVLKGDTITEINHPLLSSSNLSAATLLSFDIFHNVDYTATSSNPKKVIGFSIDPLQNKHDMERMIIFCFKDLVMKTYKTNLERVDMKILE